MWPSYANAYAGVVVVIPPAGPGWAIAEVIGFPAVTEMSRDTSESGSAPVDFVEVVNIESLTDAWVDVIGRAKSEVTKVFTGVS